MLRRLAHICPSESRQAACMPRCVAGLVATSTLILVATGCTHAQGGCDAKSKRPPTVSTPTFFGRITSDPARWAITEVPAKVRLQVAGRDVPIAANTEDFGYCGSPLSTRCYAYVSLGPSGSAAWVLLASPAQPPREAGSLEITRVTVWQVRPSSLVL